MKTLVPTIVLAAVVFTCDEPRMLETEILTVEKQRVTIALESSNETWEMPVGIPVWTVLPDEAGPNITLDVTPGGYSAWVIPDATGVSVVEVSLDMLDWFGNYHQRTNRFRVVVPEHPTPYSPLVFTFEPPVPR